MFFEFSSVLFDKEKVRRMKHGDLDAQKDLHMFLLLIPVNRTVYF